MAQVKVGMNVDAWTFQDFHDFGVAMNQSDLETAYRLAEKLIVRWDYDVSLSQEYPLNKLSFEQSSAVMATILKTVNDNAVNIDTSDVILDFRSWGTERFLQYTKARQEGKIALVESMLREVAVMPGLPEDQDAPLTYTQGCAMMKAVNDKYQRLISGKN